MANVKITVEMTPQEYQEWANSQINKKATKEKPITAILNERYPISNMCEMNGDSLFTYYDLEKDMIIELRTGPETHRLIQFLKKGKTSL